MAKKKKTSYEEWLKQNDSGVVRTADAVVTTMRGIQNTVQNATQRSRLNKYNTPGFNPYESYSTAVQYGKDLQSMYDSYKGQNLFVNSLKAGQNPLDAYRQESLLKNAITRHNTYMDGIADEAAFNEQIAYPMRFSGLTSAAGVDAQLKGMQQTISGFRQSGQTEKANAMQAEYDWLSQHQYDYWTEDDYKKNIAYLEGEIGKQEDRMSSSGEFVWTPFGYVATNEYAGTDLTEDEYRNLQQQQASNARELSRLENLKTQLSNLQAAKERNAYRDVFSNLSAEERNRVSDAAKVIARYGGWDYARRENLDSYKNAVKSLQNAGYSIEESDAIIRYATLDATALNRAEMLKGVSDWAGQNDFTKAIGSIASIPMSIQGGVGYLGMLADKFTSIGQTDPFTGEGFRVDTNAAATAMSDLSQALRGAASKDMSGFGSLVYNATMSFADSMLAMATGEWAGEAALGLSAATQATRDAYARGATDTQALIMGGMAGLAESLFEHVSIDKLRIMRTSSAASRKTIREFALDWVKQSFTEASEEGATDIANLISDAIIMGDKSELNTMIKQYRDSGMSESDATVQAWKEWGSQLLQDMAAGALSGGMGTVVNTGIGTFRRNAGYVSEGRKILDAGNASTLKELGSALPEGSYGRGLAENVNADGTGIKTARQLGAIASELNQNTLRQGVQNRLEQLGAENASETATAIMRELNGQTTTRAQDQLLKSKAAQRVLTEFRNAAEGSTNYTNEWAYDALYENAERGRNLRTNDEAVKEVAEFAKDYGRHEEAVNKLFKLNSDMPVESFKTGFDAAYTMGKNGVDMEQAMTATATQRMSETQRALAWEIGRSAANNTTTEEGVNVNGEEGSVSVPGGGERYDGARAEESVGKLAEGAEPSKGNGQVLSRSAKDSGAADLKYEVEPVSTADFGIAGGTKNKSIYRVIENQKLTPAVQAAVDTAKANGRNIVLFGGGNLEVRDGDAIASVRGLYDPNTNTMYVRVDHEKYTAEQIAKHENGHGLIAEGRITVKEVKDYMKRTMDEEAVNQALADYADAYDGINISDEELWHEIICDALGSMNIFEGIDVFSEQAERAEQRGEAIRNAAAEMQNGRAPPETASEEFDLNDNQITSGVKYSREETNPETLRFLNEQLRDGNVVHTYKTFLEVRDGDNILLYPPMATKQRDGNGKLKMANVMKLNVWERSVGNPDSKGIVSKVGRDGKTKWYYRLVKDNGKTVDAAYDPYQHSSDVVLNDQFESAYQRPNLVTYECVIPKSELSSGFHYKQARSDGQVVEAALPVGQHKWKKGTVAGKLKNTERSVYLTRWLMPVRRLENSEVAQKYKEILDKESNPPAIPFNVVPPGLLAELEKAGVAIDYEGSPMYKSRAKKQSFSRELSALDSDYMTAVESGDMETAQLMVDEAAKKAGYDSPKLYHGTNAFGFTVIDTRKSNDRVSFFATNSAETAGTYSGTSEPREIGAHSESRSSLGMYQLYANTDGMLELDAGGEESGHIALGGSARDYNDTMNTKSWNSYATAKQIAKYAKRRGYTGVIIHNVNDSATPESRKALPPSNVYVFFNPQSQVKSADPVTYDDAGNVIPLSERFNPENADIRYSRDLENLDELRRENERLRKRLDAAKQQTKRTTEPTLREGDVRKAARGLLKEMDSTLKVDDVADDMKALGEYMMRGEGKNERAPSWEEVKRRASEIAERIVDNASALSEASDVELYKDLRNYLRTTKLTLSEADRADVQDGYAEFEKRNFNRIKLGNDGLPVDSAYQELQEMYGKGLFPTDIMHPADQLMHIEDVLNGLRPVYENPHSFHRQEAVAWAANAVIDTLLSEDVRQTAPTFADKAEARRAADVAKERDKADARVAAERERAEKRRMEYMKRSRAAMERLREQRDRKIEKLKQSFRESKVRDRERREESAAKAKYIKRVREKAMKLGDWLLKNSDKEHIPEPLKNGVAEFLASINPLSEKTLKGETAKKDARFIKRMEALQDLIKKKKQSQDGEDVETFGGYLDLPKGYMEMFDNYLKNAREILDGTDVDTSTPLAYMSSEQLRDLDFLISTLMHSIRQMNTLTENGRFHTAIEAAHNTWDTLRGIAEYSLKRDSVKRFLQWDNTTPFYAFRRFGEGGRAVFEGLQEGWDRFAFNVSDVLDFSKKAYTDAEVKAWSKKVNAFTLENGSKIRMTTAQIMSLYELIKRDQALGHINGGGIRIADIEQGKDKVQQSEHYHFTMDDISKIVGTLTERQRNVADSLQKYMQEQGGKWGNEVSMKRFDYEAFGEEHYFPIATEGNRNTDDPEAKANDLYRLLNMSATKSLTPHANNALVVSDIFDVFADHMSDMAKYNALALPILDVLKWKNYREKVPAGDDSSNFTEYSTDREIRRAYGKGAGSWLMAFLKDMNGAQESSGRGEGWARKMISNYKVAAVAANLRVALLQPTAYVRAAYVLNPKYLAASAAISAVSLRRSAQECEKHSGIARWKGLGFYDTNISRGIREQIHDGGGVKDKIQEKSMIFAELGDKLTWGVIWNACKLEQKAKGLSGEKLTEATAKRFREVVYATQVVDSTMTRSHTMRGKSLYSSMATAFMAEPTLSYNMLLDAYMDYDADKRKTDRSTAWRKNSGKIAKALGVYCVSAAAAAIVESLADAWRDDDEYETYLQKFLEAMFGGEPTLKGILSGNLVNNLNIFAKLPLVKDLFSRLQGFGTERIDTAAFDDLVKAGEILYEMYQLSTGKIDKPTKVTYYGNMTAYGAIYQTLKALSRLTGLPVSNLSREVTGLWNNTIGRFTPSKKITTYEPKEESQIKKAVTEGWLSEEEATKLLVQKGIADNENDAYFTIRKWKTDEGKTDKLTDLLAAGDKKGFNKEVKNLLDHGVDEKEVTGAAKNKIKDLYLGHDSNGNPTGVARLSKSDAISMLQEYAGMSKDDASQAVMKWTCEVVNGFKYEDIKDQYLDGNITLERANEMRELYGGKPLDDDQLRDWKFEKEVGFSYNDIGDKLMDGEISERKAKQYWMEYGGMSQEDADDKVLKVTFRSKYPDLTYGDDELTLKRMNAYVSYGEAEDISAQDYIGYMIHIDSLRADKDANGNSISGSKMKKVAEYIDSLPLDPDQKTAVFRSYFTDGEISKNGLKLITW